MGGWSLLGVVRLLGARPPHELHVLLAAMMLLSSCKRNDVDFSTAVLTTKKEAPPVRPLRLDEWGGPQGMRFRTLLRADDRATLAEAVATLERELAGAGLPENLGGLECDIAQRLPPEAPLRMRLANTFGCFALLRAPWPVVAAQRFVRERLHDDSALSAHSPAELAGWLELTRADAFTRPAPRSKVLCEAAQVALQHARDDGERQNRVMFLPLGVPACAELRTRLCATLAPAPAARVDARAAPSREQIDHLRCVGTFLDREEAERAARSALDLVASESRIGVAFDWFAPAELAPAFERCVRGEGDPQSFRKHECLSALSAIDAARAKALVADDTLFFPTIIEHFELGAALVSGIDPVVRLKELGLLPSSYAPQPGTDRSATGLLVDAGRASFVSQPEPAAFGLLAAGLVEGLVVEGSSDRFSVWFKGERADVELSGSDENRGNAIAAALNAVMEANAVDVRWWLSRDEARRVVVGSMKGLRTALKQRLLIARLPL